MRKNLWKVANEIVDTYPYSSWPVVSTTSSRVTSWSITHWAPYESTQRVSVWRLNLVMDSPSIVRLYSSTKWAWINWLPSTMPTLIVETGMPAGKACCIRKLAWTLPKLAGSRQRHACWHSAKPKWQARWASHGPAAFASKLANCRLASHQRNEQWGVQKTWGAWAKWWSHWTQRGREGGTAASRPSTLLDEGKPGQMAVRKGNIPSQLWWWKTHGIQCLSVRMSRTSGKLYVARVSEWWDPCKQSITDACTILDMLLRCSNLSHVKKRGKKDEKGRLTISINVLHWIWSSRDSAVKKARRWEKQGESPRLAIWTTDNQAKR